MSMKNKTILSYAEAERLAVAGEFDKAEAMCLRLLEHFPDNFALQYLHSSICLLTGRQEESRRICTKLLDHPEVNADVYNTLAAISADYDGSFAQTEKWLDLALTADPGHRKALTNLALHHLRQNRFDQARVLYQRATSEENPNPEAINGLGMVEVASNNPRKAIEIFRSLVEKNPDDSVALCNLIDATAKSENIAEALRLAKIVSQMKEPGIAAVPAYSLARFYAEWDVSERLEKQAIHELKSSSNMFTLFLLANLPALATFNVSNQELMQLHQAMASVFRKYLPHRPYDSYPKAFEPAKRIRLGYISADLRNHVVNRFFRSLVNYRDRNKFEIFLYSSLHKSKEDSITEDYRRTADHFIYIAEMNVSELAQRIHDDGIHILVDLTGYTSYERVGALLYRPAPVQIGYLGYPFTYGMEEIDYVISDPWLDGPENAKYFVEKPLRLPESFITVAELPVRDDEMLPPMVRNGYITFGTLNNIYKMSPKLIEIWSEILKQVPNSRIQINHPNLKTSFSARDSIISTFGRLGISADRVDLIYDKHPSGAHILFYNEIDIALDTAPLTGGTTTVDAMWMGVPVVTLVGETHAQRLSYSIINNVGLDLSDCISFTLKDYVRCAVALAQNPERITQLRSQIPRAMRTGIMGNPARFTAQLETAYVDAWNRKFPQTPLEDLIDSESLQSLTNNNGDILVVRDQPDDKFAYILREQGTWYEEEAEFLARHADCFSSYWDFSEDPGVFAVPIASRQTVSGGTTMAIRAGEVGSRLLKHAIRENALSNLSIQPEPDATQSSPDLARFSLEFNDRNDDVVARWIKRTASGNSLLLVSLQNSTGADGRAMYHLLTAGYKGYRLLPGYDLLEPLEEGGALEESDVNLFFCGETCAQRLESKGILCREAKDLEHMPTDEQALWIGLLQSLPYARNRINAWASFPFGGEWGNMYRLVLNLHTLALDKALTPVQRMANIRAMQNLIIELVRQEATVPRLLTGIRIMADSGRRKLAAQWAGLLAENFAAVLPTADFSLEEPFLPPLIELEQVEIVGSDLVYAQETACYAFEKLRAFSTWFTGQNSLAVWKRLAQGQTVTGAAKQITELIEQRYALKARGF